MLCEVSYLSLNVKSKFSGYQFSEKLTNVCEHLYPSNFITSYFSIYFGRELLWSTKSITERAKFFGLRK